MRIDDLLKRQCNNDGVGIKQGIRELTYRDWNVLAQELSNKVNKLVFADSNCVGVFLPNSIEYAISYFGIVYSNKVVIPIGIQAKAPEILSTLKYCEIDLLITNSKYYNFVVSILEDYDSKVIVYNVEAANYTIINRDKQFIIKSNYIEKSGNEEDVAIMLHTSGTTDNPKRVMLTHGNLIANIESNIKSLELRKSDVVLMALPMFFGYCNTSQFLTHIYLGAKMVIYEGVFVAKKFFQLVEKEGITNFTGVPSMLLMILQYKYSLHYDISTLKYICFGGGKMPVGRLKELIEKFPSIGFIQTYGQTECSPRVTALMPKYSLDKIGSVGKPIPDVKIRINATTESEENSKYLVGEIEVCGKNIMKGYYKREDETECTKNGEWHRTGDLGYLDEDGFLYLTGRIKNIIISGGINIYPEEVEQIILLFDNIKEACVVGKPDDMLGEVPVAYIVLKEGKVDIKKLKEYCFTKLARYKVPVEFTIIEELPKTYNGKIKRGVLK